MNKNYYQKKNSGGFLCHLLCQRFGCCSGSFKEPLFFLAIIPVTLSTTAAQLTWQHNDCSIVWSLALQMLEYLTESMNGMEVCFHIIDPIWKWSNSFRLSLGCSCEKHLKWHRIRSTELCKDWFRFLFYGLFMINEYIQQKVVGRKTHFIVSSA